MIGACIKSDWGQLLTYTIRSTQSQCLEDFINTYGENQWKILERNGAKVVSIEIKEVIKDGE